MTAIVRTIAAVALLVLSACAEADEAPPAEQPTPEETAAGTEQTAGDAVVAVGSTDLGDVLVDGEGMTLYLFEPDAQGTPTCTDSCAEAWPPLVAADPVVGDGADESLLGTVARDDGSMQVTYNGWPLYRWASDEAPGDTTGQGVNDVWWVVAPDGTALKDD